MTVTKLGAIILIEEDEEDKNTSKENGEEKPDSSTKFKKTASKIQWKNTQSKSSLQLAFHMLFYGCSLVFNLKKRDFVSLL